LFAFGLRVLDGDRQVILQHGFRIGKRNTMLLEIRCSFGRIVLEAPGAMIYTLYA
jgi:hypothetical protein